MGSERSEPDYRTVSMCPTAAYCRGWNDAVDCIRTGRIVHNTPEDLEARKEYLDGWNDAYGTVR